MTTHKPLIRTLFAALIAATAWQISYAAQDKAATSALEASAKVELPGYEGDFDHFEVDLKGNRLFLAA